MRTFDDEYRELLTWLFKKRDEIEKNVKPWSGGLDGEQTDAMRTVTAEYRAKLKELKWKYEQREKDGSR